MSTPQIRCNVCDSVLTVGWNTDDEGAYAYVDPCPKCSTTLRAQLVEAREANERLTKRLRWIRVNPNDAVAMRFALVATDEEFDDIRSKE